MRFLSSIKPDIISVAYALFLATNATIIWGGVFPFLPIGFQTPGLTVTFFLSQSLIFAAGCLLTCLLSYIAPTWNTSIGAKTLFPTVTTYLGGWACLIAAMYLDDIATPLALISGGLIGFGTNGFFLAWQNLFCASKLSDRANTITRGMLYTPFIYFALYLLPEAIAAFLIPLIFMPLFTLALIVQSRRADFSRKMFTHNPREHRDRYVQTVRDYWRSILCVATIGFACGVMRSIAISDAGVGMAVNVTSMLGALISALGLFAFWQLKPMRLNVASFYRALFPFIITGFFLLPLIASFSSSYVIVFAGILYALYTAIILFMVIQCVQAAREREIRPLFIYGLFGGTVYFSHDFGFLSGQFAENLLFFDMDVLPSVSFIAIFIMAIMFFVGQGGWKSALSPNRIQAEHIDLFTTAGTPGTRERMSAGDAHGAQAHVTDRLSKRCKQVAKRYGLSEREAEVMELVARGYTVVRIADELLISQNTVRTHTKRLYAKLDVHKKQEMLDIIESFAN